jgi:hypothetical protein
LLVDPEQRSIIIKSKSIDSKGVVQLKLNLKLYPHRAKLYSIQGRDALDEELEILHFLRINNPSIT